MYFSYNLLLNSKDTLNRCMPCSILTLWLTKAKVALNVTNRSRLNRTCSTATNGDDSRTGSADCSHSPRRAAPLRTPSATTRRLVGGLFRSVRSPNCLSGPLHSLETTPSAVLSTLLGPVNRHRQITNEFRL